MIISQLFNIEKMTLASLNAFTNQLKAENYKTMNKKSIFTSNYGNL